MPTVIYTFDDYYDIVCEFLNDYQLQALNDTLSGFGCSVKTLDTMLYVWFGMETEAFIDEMVGA